MTPGIWSRLRDTPVLALLGITALALAARLLVLPLATTDGGDPSARIWMAWRWLADPELITHGVWGPLHFYLIGGALALVPDPVLAPIVLHVLFGVGACWLMFAVSREEFGSARAALLVAAMYALYPVAIRNSVMARSETPFVGFMLATMLLLAVARSPRGRPIHAAAAGLTLTLAAMLRYEAWVLIPLFGLALWRRPAFLLRFGALALVHPILWMIGNQVASGDPLYSFTWATNYALGERTDPAAVNLKEAVTYPWVTLKGMNLFVGAIAGAGALWALVERHRARIWLVAFAGVAALYLMSIGRGTLVPKLNYTIILGTLLWPFIAQVFRRIGIDRWGRPVFLSFAFGGLGIMALFDFLVSRDGVGSWRAGQFTASPVPRIENQEIALTLPRVITASLRSGEEGLVSDFYGWGSTQHVALLTRLHPDRIFLAPGAAHLNLDPERLGAFLKRYPQGVLILHRGSRFERALRPPDADPGIAGWRLILEPIREVPWPPGSTLDILRYQVMAVIAAPMPDGYRLPTGYYVDP